MSNDRLLPPRMISLHRISFDIEAFLDRHIPPPPWQYIPYPIAYFLGYRRQSPNAPYGNLILTFRALLGAFTSLFLIQLASHQILDVATKGPIIVGSFGAAAVLEFYVPESPFAQPRNFLVSQIFASVIGVSFSKLFQHQQPLGGLDGDWMRWIAAALACGITSAFMSLTQTVHPPAGATALIAVVDNGAVALGWNFIPLVLLACAIMLAVALLLNNALGSFPIYWWTAANYKAAKPGPSSSEKKFSSPSTNNSDVELGKGEQERVEIVVGRGHVIVPPALELTLVERSMLEAISKRLFEESVDP